MKIFLDTADKKAIKEWLPSGLVDGITTNPTLLSKEGKELCKRHRDSYKNAPDNKSRPGESTIIEPEHLGKLLVLITNNLKDEWGAKKTNIFLSSVIFQSPSAKNTLEPREPYI